MTDDCHPELNSGSINVDLEPSPAFVTFAHAHEQLLPLTKREGNRFNDKVYSLFTTHHSLIHPYMNFSRFTSHFSLKPTDARHLAYISIVDKHSTDLLEINSAFSFLFLRSFLGNSIGVTIPQFEFIG